MRLKSTKEMVIVYLQRERNFGTAGLSQGTSTIIGIAVHLVPDPDKPDGEEARFDYEYAICAQAMRERPASRRRKSNSRERLTLCWRGWDSNHKSGSRSRLMLSSMLAGPVGSKK